MNKNICPYGRLNCGDTDCKKNSEQLLNNPKFNAAPSFRKKIQAAISCHEKNKGCPQTKSYETTIF